MSDFISCNNKDLTPEQLLSALVTKTESGEWAIRTMQVEACAEDALDCSNIRTMSAFDIIKNVSVLLNAVNLPFAWLFRSCNKSGVTPAF